MGILCTSLAMVDGGILHEPRKQGHVFRSTVVSSICITGERGVSHFKVCDGHLLVEAWACG